MTVDSKLEILTLRQKGLTSKEIARKLGLKTSQVNSAIKANAQEITTSRTDTEELAPIAQCLVDTNCVQRLLHNQTVEETEIGGLGMLLVSRSMGYNRFVVCSYLVDYWCLGLKDTMGEKKFNDKLKYQQFLSMVYQGFSNGYEEISLEQAQAIVYGAIAYADKLGFKPHKDFEKTRNHLGSWSGESQLNFGRDGKPFYIQGRYDNVNHIMETLKENVGEENFDYMVVT